jgi:hypothetical protein
MQCSCGSIFLRQKSSGSIFLVVFCDFDSKNDERYVLPSLFGTRWEPEPPDQYVVCSIVVAYRWICRQARAASSSTYIISGVALIF